MSKFPATAIFKLLPPGCRMRWRIRWQLLLPPLLLVAGVVVVSVWLAVLSADQARRQVEERVRSVARNLGEEASYPLSENVLRQMKRLSGADFLLVPRDGSSVCTIPGVSEAPATAPVTDWQTLRLGPPTAITGRNYRCSGIRLSRPPRAGDTLFILYPEAQWRDAQWQSTWPVLVLGASACLASLGLAAGLGRGLSRRVAELERRTRVIAAGDFSPVPLPARDDEIRDLARSVNEMAERLAGLQDAARRTERLRLLGQLSGGLAHQLRNGLAGARLSLQLLSGELPADVDASALEVAMRQLTLLESYLKRFLDLGREGGRAEPCDLVQLTDEAVGLLRPRCRHAGTELRWEPPARPASVSGDPGSLGQLVLNLLGNAVDAAGPGGWVSVRVADAGPEKSGSGATPETGPVGEPGGTCLLEVSDSGVGPPPEIAERLFEPFVTGKPEGVGLGLAVARQVAEAHGGHITWRRESDHTCFRVEFPRDTGREPAAAAVPEAVEA